VHYKATSSQRTEPTAAYMNYAYVTFGYVNMAKRTADSLGAIGARLHSQICGRGRYGYTGI